MFGFKKKKKDNLDLAFEKTFDEMRKLDSWNDPKKLERYILDSSEQIVSTAKEIEAEKKEYRIVTNYLKDIEILEKMPQDEKDELKGMASSLVELNRTRTGFENRESRISEKNYTLMDENEDSIPSTIERLTQNEIYQDSLSKDMHRLEGEKSAIEIERDSFKRKIKFQGIISITFFISCLIISGVMFAIQYYSKTDLQLFQLILLLFAASVFVMIFLKDSSLKRRNKRSLKYLNKIIPMLNAIRMKYVNITSAVNYVYSNYDIASSKELEYLWNNYQNEKRDRELYNRNNKDIEVCNDRFMDFLKSKNLYDPKVWQFQAIAFVNQDEMVEVKHRLIQRRQKIRDQINSNMKAVKLERDEIDRIMQEHSFYVPEIIEIIQSVDRLCGLNQYKKRNPGAETGRQRRN
jgi:dihydrodipicolinate reductase